MPQHRTQTPITEPTQQDLADLEQLVAALHAVLPDPQSARETAYDAGATRWSRQ